MHLETPDPETRMEIREASERVEKQNENKYGMNPTLIVPFKSYIHILYINILDNNTNNNKEKPLPLAQKSVEFSAPTIQRFKQSQFTQKIR